MKLTMLGTGNAAVTECYNTCFVLEDGGEYLMVDGGGGFVVARLKAAGFRWQDMRRIFVTHKHVDHLLGVLWMIRMITQGMNRGSFDGEAWIYSHSEVIEILRNMAFTLLSQKETRHIGERLHLVTLEDGEEFTALSRRVQVFDIGSTKDRQFGFTMYCEESKLTCCGDEPYNPREEQYARNAAWLLHEAFCLYDERDIFKPYQKHHSTVKDACELAESLGVRNLVLYHTEDSHIRERKALYTAEGKRYFSGELYVPEDLERIELF